MATLHLMVGLPCSGKTTLAKQLEHDLPALRLSPDEWMLRVVVDAYDEPKRAIVEAMLWEIAARVLALGSDVVLDYGFWSKQERDDFRQRAAAVGASMTIHFLDVPREELHRRLLMRNADLSPDTVPIQPSDLDTWLAMFERPTDDETARNPRE